MRPTSYDIDYLEKFYTADKASTRGLEGGSSMTLTMQPHAEFMEPVAIAVDVRSSADPTLRKIAWFFNAQIAGCNQWEWRNLNGDTVQNATSFVTSDAMDPFQRGGKAMPLNFGIYANPANRDILCFTIGNPHPKGDKIDVHVTVYAQEHSTLPLYVTKDNFFRPRRPASAAPSAPERRSVFPRETSPIPARAMSSIGVGIGIAWAKHRAANPLFAHQRRLAATELDLNAWMQKREVERQAAATRSQEMSTMTEKIMGGVNAIMEDVLKDRAEERAATERAATSRGMTMRMRTLASHADTCRTPTIASYHRDAHPALLDARLERKTIATWVRQNRHGYTSPAAFAGAIENGDHLQVLGSCGAWDDVAIDAGSPDPTQQDTP